MSANGIEDHTRPLRPPAHLPARQQPKQLAHIECMTSSVSSHPALEGRADLREARATEELSRAVPVRRCHRTLAKNTSLAGMVAVRAHANTEHAKAICALRAVVDLSRRAAGNARLCIFAPLPAVKDCARQRAIMRLPQVTIARICALQRRGVAGLHIQVR